jgi:DNA-binding NarL/FixJ family response regulator
MDDRPSRFVQPEWDKMQVSAQISEGDDGEVAGGGARASMIRVAIVEDHPAIADGLAALVAGSPGVTVVGTARDVQSADTLIEHQAPDVVLCDVRLADPGDGFDLVRRHRAASAFIILSAYWYPSYHVRAVELGAKGYLSKMATIDQIVRAVETVAAGGTAFPVAARRAASDALRVPTPRELEILALVAEGLSNAEIGERLALRIKTVESQLRRLFDRYDVTSRTALVHLAAQQGWIEEGS